MSNISKEAQERSVWKELGRAFNPKEQFRYHGFKDYREIYDAISKVDKDMRAKALEEAPGTKDSIHEARMAFKRREFPKVVYYAMKVMDSVAGVFDEVEKLNEIRQTMFSRFYAGNAGKGGLSDEQLREMHEALGRKPAEDKKAKAHIQSLLYTTAVPEPWEINSEAIIRQAGPMQWLREQAPSWKGMKFDLIDSVFQNRAAKQRAAAKEALRIAEDSYKKIKEIFSNLEDNLSNFSEYVKIANTAKTSMDGFREKLRGIYQKNFADIVPDMSNYNEKADESGGAKVEGDEATKDQARMPERNVPPTQPMEAQPSAQTQPMPAQQPEQLSLQFPQAPQEPSPQLSFDFTSGLELDNSGQLLQPVDEYGQPIAAAAAADRDVMRLLKRAQVAMDCNQRGLAVALLVKASDICDLFNKESQAIDLLKTAQRISQG
jgi:hypothetical protein